MISMSKTIVDYLLSHNGWEVDNYTASCDGVNTKVWMANIPIVNTNTYPVALINPLNLRQKRRLRKHILFCHIENSLMTGQAKRGHGLREDEKDDEN